MERTRARICQPGSMFVLALDVDGVLLDPDRGGAGHWTNEMERNFAITRAQFREAFFTRSWDDVVNGRMAVEAGVAGALAALDTDVAVEDFLRVWFEADFEPVDEAVALACRAGDAGCRVVLATNQEHRRAAFLRERLGAIMPIDDVLYSADLGVQKHEATFFERASARLGVDIANRGDVVFVDDLEHNVEQARAARWRAVHAVPDGPVATWVTEVDRLLGL
jgi:putative hydrolase of the HAD superfamily